MEQKTKLLFFIESLAGGGAEKVLTTLVSHIDKTRFEVTVAAVTPTGIHAEQVSSVAAFKPLIKRDKGIIYKLLYHIIYYVLPLKLVYKWFMPKGNDIEVAYCEGFATKLLAHSPARRKMAWVHIDLIANPWTQNSVYSSVGEERKAYSRYDRILCVSDNVRESFEEKFGIRATTVYNPIDSANITERSREIVTMPEKSKIRMVTTGRLVPQKGYDRLLKIVKRLRNEKYDFELWILGDGPDREELGRYISKNGLEGTVKLWGFVPNPYPYIASGDLFVCSSRSEGYSTAATEAIILGVPVVTTLCAGMKELLGDNDDYGCIVPNDDTSLYAPLEKVLTDSTYLDRLKEKAAVRRNDFSIDTLMKPIEELLQ